MAEASLVTPITADHFDAGIFDVPATAYPKLPPRVRIEAAIETLIEILDAANPDTDFEETGAEDSFHSFDDDGPGCPLADPDYAVDDVPCDPESDF